MISFFIKFTISFSLSYLLLTIPVNGRHLFWHLYDITGPLGGKVKKSVSVNLNESYEKTKKIGQQFFLNSEPRKIIEPLSAKHKKIIQDRERYNRDLFVKEEINTNDTRVLNNLIKNSK